MTMAEIIQILGQNILLSALALIVILSVLVFVHEWGHYIIARMCGVRVQTFSIGFGKELIGFNDKAGTRWKISLIPLGGYVQLFGDTDPASARHSAKVEDEDGAERVMTEAEREVAFFNKPVWQRAAVVFAGPAINYIFAVILLAGVYVTQGQPTRPPTVAGIVGGSSADASGFQPHDYILSVDGKTITAFRDLSREMMIALDQEKHFVVRRGDEIIDIYAAPKREVVEDRFGFKSSIGRLGVLGPGDGISVTGINYVDGVKYDTPEDIRDEIEKRLDTTFAIGMDGKDENGKDIISSFIISPTSYMNEEFGQQDVIEAEAIYLSNLEQKTFTPHTMMTAVQSAVRETYVLTRNASEAIWQMIVGVRSAGDLGGIVRIGAIAGDVAQQGIIAFIVLAAVLSVNLGFINLLPIPMLDGGHLLFYGIESILGRPVPEKIQDYAFQAGFVFLIGIMAFANLNDIYQLLT